MGWIAYTKDGERLSEETHSRPVQAGEEGKLLAIAQEDNGRRIAIDLTGGVVFIDYEDIKVNNGYLEVSGFKTMFFICDETTRIAEQFIQINGEVDSEGFYTTDYEPYVWRPIWFTRWFNGYNVKVIGAQTTYQNKNVKKMVTIFGDGTIGLD